MKDQLIVVTGAGGFIGGHLVGHLMQQGHGRIRGVDIKPLDGWYQVHDEAEKLEHVISEELEERMSSALGNPTLDPHGAPIPARDGSFERVESHLLSESKPGTTVKVVEVDDRDPELLRYLGELQLYPGTAVEVIRVEPCDGPFVLGVGGKELILGRAAAREVLVSAPVES